jgi:TPP-dependent pyruvate/acetoin dehydrogenase alpha subunit
MAPSTKTQPKPAVDSASAEEYKKYLRQMLLIRRFE